MTNALSKVLCHLFPPYDSWVANLRLDKKIKALENNEGPLVYMEGYSSFSYEEIEKYLGKTYEVKKTLEDKAKTNILGVTISVSLMIGLSQFFSSNMAAMCIYRCGGAAVPVVGEPPIRNYRATLPA